MGKHTSTAPNTARMAPYRVSFVDEFTGDEAAEDFGFDYETVAEARKAAEAAWAETSCGGEASASEIKWEGAIGTCYYKMGFVGINPDRVTAFTCHFIVTRH